MSSQYFRLEPSDEVVNKVLLAFGLNGLNDDRVFTREDIVAKNVVENIYDISKELEFYYFPHKVKWVLTDLTEKSVVNILRHVVKVKGYSLKCFGNKKREVAYQVVPSNNRPSKPSFQVIKTEGWLVFN